MSLKRLPSICLVAAIWTNTIQTFLQVTYAFEDIIETAISRAEEFQISFYCQSEESPFGFTTKKDLSLDILAHDEHKHMPISWVNLWVLRRPKSQESEDAAEQSSSTTSHFLNWHRHNDDSLWLDHDGTLSIKDIRRLQNHLE
ncbi:hypothetical protein N7463_008579 [Penicillium fimorum]|uniref:Uncharacterized protein n=1 Tax=Penicillium fimorum TaxID=1882269 RepID=A0A9W9XP57_9EURO|nr:hypothetical protein N7463_008579 [Penicillium fimorum]